MSHTRKSHLLRSKLPARLFGSNSIFYQHRGKRKGRTYCHQPWVLRVELPPGEKPEDTGERHCGPAGSRVTLPWTLLFAPWPLGRLACLDHVPVPSDFPWVGPGDPGRTPEDREPGWWQKDSGFSAPDLPPWASLCLTSLLFLQVLVASPFMGHVRPTWQWQPAVPDLTAMRGGVSMKLS